MLQVICTLLAILSLASRSFAQENYTSPGSQCELPDFSSPGLGPPGPRTTENESTGVDVDSAVAARVECEFSRSATERVNDMWREWGERVVGCFDDPESPAWYKCDFRCLLDAVTTPRPSAKDEPVLAADIGTSWITETEVRNWVP